MWDDSPDVTLFGAWGPIEQGPDALRATFEWVGSRFGPAGGLTPDNTIARGQWRLMHRHADFPPSDQRPAG